MSDHDLSLAGDLLTHAAGLRVSDVRVGPAGVNIDAHGISGAQSTSNNEVAFWIQGGLRIKNRHEEFFSSPPCPSEDCQVLLLKLLLGKRINEVVISPASNVLRVLFEDDLLLSGYPKELNGEAYSCMVYFPGASKTKYIIIGASRVEYKEEAKDNNGHNLAEDDRP